MLSGHRDDTVTSSVAVNVDGGSGHDRLAGSPFADALYGGRGRDVVRGNEGDDVLRDGRLPRLIPPDQVERPSFPPLRAPPEPVPSERDVFDDGLGTVTPAAGRRGGVTVDLARFDRRAGAPGEEDALRGLESRSDATATTGSR